MNIDISIAIRQMERADLSAMLEIQSLCYTEVEPESEQSLSAKLSASPSTCFVAVQNSVVIGYLISLPWTFSSPPPLNASGCEMPKHPDCLYLHDVAVTPAARKLGAARRLIEKYILRIEELSLGRGALIAVQNSSLYWERYGFCLATSFPELEQKLLTYGTNVKYMERKTQSPSAIRK